MKVSIQQTQAETDLARHFSGIATDLPGGDEVAAARNAAIAEFKDKGLPHRRIEAWKYTDLRARLKTAFEPATHDATTASWQALETALGPLAGLDAARFVLVDGVYVAELSSVDTLGEGVCLRPTADVLSDKDAARDQTDIGRVDADHGVVALNTAFMTDGASVDIDAKPNRALHIIHVATATSEKMISTRNRVRVADGIDATVIESFVALEETANQINTLTLVNVGKGARLHHVKVQRENTASTHLATWVVDLAEGADYRGFQFTSGGALTRHQIGLTYNGENAKADISGVNLLCGRQHCDTTMVVDHAVPSCESREVFKLVLDDEARGVFQGRVIVRPDAQKSDGKQMAQALMLAEACEFDAKPELEIYADDVVCGHGATCAELDPDLIFYCRSRGIDAETARALMTESFVAETFEKVADNAIAEALLELSRDWLARKRS